MKKSELTAKNSRIIMLLKKNKLIIMIIIIIIIIIYIYKIEILGILHIIMKKCITI